MKDSNYRISLDVRQTQSQATIPVKINDVSRKLYISLTDGGTPYIIEEGCFAVLSGIKSDGTTLLNNCIIEDNVIRYDFTQQTVSAQGMVICEVILYDVNGGLLLSPHITIIVDDRAGKASSTVSYNEHNFIDQALEAEQLRKEAELSRDRSEVARVTAENTRQTQETERVEAEFLRTLEEETRASNEEARKTNEARRVSAEQARTTNELVRSQNESSRVTAEKARASAEAARVNAEAKREIAIETAKAMTIECEASGEVITLNDASNAPLSNLKLYGRTTQKTTTGKQKIAYPYINTTKTVDGITFTNLGDGGVKVSGTATGGGAYFVLNGGYAGNKVAIPNWLVPGNSYTISGGNDSVAVEVCLYENEGGTGKTFLKTFTMPSGYIYYGIFIYVPLNTKVDTIIYPMVRDASVTDDTYEPYTYGPSPNPNYPQELKSVGDSGSFEVGVYGGKNFVEITTDTKTSAGVTFTRNADNSFSLNGTGNANNVYNIGRAYLIQGTSYKLTGSASGGASNSYLIRVIGNNNVTVAEDLGSGKTFTPTTTGFYTVAIRIQSGTVTDGLTFYPMIRYAEITDNTYEPCDKQTLTMPYNPLRIPVSVDHNYIDGNGKKFIRDEIDLNKGIFNSRIIKIVLNGSETYTLNSNGVIQGVLVGVKGNWANYLALSTHFTYNSTMINSGEAGYFAIDGGGGVRFTTDFTTVAEFKTWLQSNNVTIYAVRATPIETPLSEAELNAYRQLHTNKPNTIIYNSDSAQQEVTYVADTKTYIDNKFAALTAATEGVV